MNSEKKQKKNTMGKTKDLFKNVRDIKATFHVRMGTTKDAKDLTEAEESKTR